MTDTTNASTTTSSTLDKSAFDPAGIVAAELNLPLRGVAAVVKLLAEGATVPFIARYRKEVTGGLDEHVERLLGLKPGYHPPVPLARKATVCALVLHAASDPWGWLQVEADIKRRGIR